MAKDSKYEFQETMVTLTDEDGVDKDFYVDEIYEIGNQLYVFRIKDLGNDDFELEDIESEEEYDAAADAYEEKLDVRAWNRTFGEAED